MTQFPLVGETSLSFCGFVLCFVFAPELPQSFIIPRPYLRVCVLVPMSLSKETSRFCAQAPRDARSHRWAGRSTFRGSVCGMGFDTRPHRSGQGLSVSVDFRVLCELFLIVRLAFISPRPYLRVSSCGGVSVDRNHPVCDRHMPRGTPDRGVGSALRISRQNVR